MLRKIGLSAILVASLSVAAFACSCAGKDIPKAVVDEKEIPLDAYSGDSVRYLQSNYLRFFEADDLDSAFSIKLDVRTKSITRCRCEQSPFMYRVTNAGEDTFRFDPESNAVHVDKLSMAEGCRVFDFLAILANDGSSYAIGFSYGSPFLGDEYLADIRMSEGEIIDIEANIHRQGPTGWETETRNVQSADSLRSFARAFSSVRPILWHRWFDPGAAYGDFLVRKTDGSVISFGYANGILRLNGVYSFCFDEYVMDFFARFSI